jgi:hypothetical protein
MKDKQKDEGKLQQTIRNEHGITRGPGITGGKCHDKSKYY